VEAFRGFVPVRRGGDKKRRGKKKGGGWALQEKGSRHPKEKIAGSSPRRKTIKRIKQEEGLRELRPSGTGKAGAVGCKSLAAGFYPGQRPAVGRW